jgi:DNA-binding NtrC family response regulator
VETVLVSADDRATSIVLAMILRSLGYSVLEAEDWDDAIRQCESLSMPVEMLVKDVKSPDRALAESIKRFREVNPNIRVLLVCDHAVQPSAYGDVTVVQKPTSLVVMARVLRELLETTQEGVPGD